MPHLSFRMDSRFWRMTDRVASPLRGSEDGRVGRPVWSCGSLKLSRCRLSAQPVPLALDRGAGWGRIGGLASCMERAVRHRSRARSCQPSRNRQLRWRPEKISAGHYDPLARGFSRNGQGVRTPAELSRAGCNEAPALASYFLLAIGVHMQMSTPHGMATCPCCRGLGYVISEFIENGKYVSQDQWSADHARQVADAQEQRLELQQILATSFSR